MVTFKYTAMSPAGERVSGVMEGFNAMDAAERIKKTCPVILKMDEVKQTKSLLNMEIGGNKLDPKAFTLMCSQFAIILKSGIPIARTVQLIADKMTDKPLKRVLKEVAEDVEAGRSISVSFEERGKKLLPATFIETLRAGEESGNLDRAFDSMARHFEKSTKTKAKVKSALAYPVFVLVIAVIVVIVIMAKVVPTFTAIFAEQGADLPGITKALIAMSDFFAASYLYIIAAIAAVVLGYKFYGKTESGRLKEAQWGLKIPVLGNISYLNAASEFANSMTTLLGSGLTLVKAVTITARTMSNYYMSQETGKLAGKLEEGHALGASMREAGIMPDILIDMTAVGEETGELTGTLDTVATYYDAELEQATARAIAKLEPTLLVGLAGIAGFIVIAIYMAMFEMYAGM